MALEVVRADSRYRPELTFTFVAIGHEPLFALATLLGRCFADLGIMIDVGAYLAY